jgi:type I restriction enzyme S subunit
VKPIDISPGDLATVRRILREHVPESEVWAFGSRVSWTARETSDLDLAIITATPLPPVRMAELREAFAESDLPFTVDLVDWAVTGEKFRQIIARERAVVQENALL